MESFYGLIPKTINKKESAINLSERIYSNGMACRQTTVTLATPEAEAKTRYHMHYRRKNTSSAHCCMYRLTSRTAGCGTVVRPYLKIKYLKKVMEWSYSSKVQLARDA